MNNFYMKKMLLSGLFLVSLIAFTSSFISSPEQSKSISSLSPADTVQYPDEHHFKNVQQLTFGGDNAEAYFSFDSKYIIFQRTNPKAGILCDQMWIGKVPAPGEKFEPRLISSGK